MYTYITMSELYDDEFFPGKNFAPLSSTSFIFQKLERVLLDGLETEHWGGFPYNNLGSGPVRFDGFPCLDRRW